MHPNIREFKNDTIMAIFIGHNKEKKIVKILKIIFLMIHLELFILI